MSESGPWKIVVEKLWRKHKTNLWEILRAKEIKFRAIDWQRRGECGEWEENKYSSSDEEDEWAKVNWGMHTRKIIEWEREKRQQGQSNTKLISYQSNILVVNIFVWHRQKILEFILNSIYVCMNVRRTIYASLIKNREITENWSGIALQKSNIIIDHTHTSMRFIIT